MGFRFFVVYLRSRPKSPTSKTGLYSCGAYRVSAVSASHGSCIQHSCPPSWIRWCHLLTRSVDGLGMSREKLELLPPL